MARRAHQSRYGDGGFRLRPVERSEAGFQAVFSSRMGNSAKGNSDTYYSKDGTFEANTGKVSREGGLIERYVKGAWKATALKERTLSEERKSAEMANMSASGENAVVAHMRNWLECVRSRKAPAADIQAGYNHSVALCMTIAAMHSGKRATFDDAKQEAVAG